MNKWYYEDDLIGKEKLPENLASLSLEGNCLLKDFLNNGNKMDISKQIDLYQHCLISLKNNHQDDLSSLLLQRTVYEIIFNNGNSEELDKQLFLKDDKYDKIVGKKVVAETLAYRETIWGRNLESLGVRLTYAFNNLNHLKQPYLIDDIYRDYYVQDSKKLGDGFKEVGDILHSVLIEDSLEDVLYGYDSLYELNEILKNWKGRDLDIPEFMNRLPTLSKKDPTQLTEDDSKTRTILSECMLNSYNLARKFYWSSPFEEGIPRWNAIGKIHLGLVNIAPKFKETEASIKKDAEEDIKRIKEIYPQAKNEKERLYLNVLESVKYGADIDSSFLDVLFHSLEPQRTLSYLLEISDKHQDNFVLAPYNPSETIEAFQKVKEYVKGSTLEDIAKKAVIGEIDYKFSNYLKQKTNESSKPLLKEINNEFEADIISLNGISKKRDLSPEEREVLLRDYISLFSNTKEIGILDEALNISHSSIEENSLYRSWIYREKSKYANSQEAKIEFLKKSLNEWKKIKGELNKLTCSSYESEFLHPIRIELLNLGEVEQQDGIKKLREKISHGNVSNHSLLPHLVCQNLHLIRDDSKLDPQIHKKKLLNETLTVLDSVHEEYCSNCKEYLKHFLQFFIEGKCFKEDRNRLTKRLGIEEVIC